MRILRTLENSATDVSNHSERSNCSFYRSVERSMFDRTWSVESNLPVSLIVIPFEASSIRTNSGQSFLATVVLRCPIWARFYDLSRTSNQPIVSSKTIKGVRNVNADANDHVVVIFHTKKLLVGCYLSIPSNIPMRFHFIPHNSPHHQTALPNSEHPTSCRQLLLRHCFIRIGF